MTYATLAQKSSVGIFFCTDKIVYNFFIDLAWNLANLKIVAIESANQDWHSMPEMVPYFLTSWTSTIELNLKVGQNLGKRIKLI